MYIGVRSYFSSFFRKNTKNILRIAALMWLDNYIQINKVSPSLLPMLCYGRQLPLMKQAWQQSMLKMIYFNPSADTTNLTTSAYNTCLHFLKLSSWFITYFLSYPWEIKIWRERKISKSNNIPYQNMWGSINNVGVLLLALQYLQHEKCKRPTPVTVFTMKMINSLLFVSSHCITRASKCEHLKSRWP